MLFAQGGKVIVLHVRHALCRPVAGAARAPPTPKKKNFRFEINSAIKVEFCLLKWTAVNGSYSFQVLSIIVRLCTVVLLYNLELCKGKESYFCSAKYDQQLLKYLLIFHKNRQAKWIEMH